MRRRRLFPTGTEHGLQRQPTREKPENRFVYANVTLTTSCDAELIEKFCQKIARGVPPTAACDSLCIMDTTFQDWVGRGENWLRGQGDENDPISRMCGGFVLGMRKAGGHWVEGRVRALQADGNREWKRDMTLLERRDPMNFGEHVEGGTHEQYDPDECFV